MNIKSKLEALEEAWLEAVEAKTTYRDNESDLAFKLDSIIRHTEGLSFSFEDGELFITAHVDAFRQCAYTAINEMYSLGIKELLDKNKDLYINYLSLLNKYYNQQYEISDYLKDNREKYSIPESTDIRIISANVFFYHFSTEADSELGEKFYQLVENSDEY